MLFKNVTTKSLMVTEEHIFTNVEIFTREHISG